WRRARPQVWRAIAMAGVVIVAAGLAFARHRPEVIPLALVALVVAAVAFRRARSTAGAPPRGKGRSVLAYLGALTITLVVALNAAFIEIFDPLANAPFHDLFGG